MPRTTTSTNTSEYESLIYDAILSSYKDSQASSPLNRYTVSRQKLFTAARDIYLTRKGSIPSVFKAVLKRRVDSMIRERRLLGVKGSVRLGSGIAKNLLSGSTTRRGKTRRSRPNTSGNKRKPIRAHKPTSQESTKPSESTKSNPKVRKPTRSGTSGRYATRGSGVKPGMVTPAIPKRSRHVKSKDMDDETDNMTLDQRIRIQKKISPIPTKTFTKKIQHKQKQTPTSKPPKKRSPATLEPPPTAPQPIETPPTQPTQPTPPTEQQLRIKERELAVKEKELHIQELKLMIEARKLGIGVE